MTGKDKKTQNPEKDQPQIEIPCPHCGGASIWNLLETLHQCEYCGSVLSWPYPEGEPDYLIAEPVVRNESDLIEVLAMYDAMREASRRRGAMRQNRSGDEDILIDLGAGFTDTSVYEIKRERIHLFRILKSFCVYAPYQLISSLLAFYVLGRVGSDQKVFRPMFFNAETILPGYGEEWNFRDRGLYVSKHKLKPLLSIFGKGELVPSKTTKWSEKFLATGVVTKEIEKITRNWTGQKKIVDSEIKPICFEGKALESHRWWVYRPYYFVNAQTPQSSGWFLIDGQFGTIAGTPGALEVSKLTRGNWKKLDLHSVRSCEVRVVPFRCPNCGWDIKLKKGTYQICDNCTRLLEVKGDGFEMIPYEIIPAETLSWWPRNHRGPKVWLPFWRVEPSMLLEKKSYDDLARVLAFLLPAFKSEGSIKQIWVPAFDCWTIAKYDQWAFDFGASMGSSSDVSYYETSLHIMKSQEDFMIPPIVSGDLLVQLFPQVLARYASPAAQMRMNTLLIQRLSGVHVLLNKKKMVFVPAALVKSRGREPIMQGPQASMEWLPFKEERFPPALIRNVRRWLARSQQLETNASVQPRMKGLGSMLIKRY